MDLAAHTAPSPEAVGIDPEKLEQLFARAKRDVDEGGLPSCQVAVARHGLLAGMRTFGNAMQGGQEQPANDATLYHYFSSTKAIVGAAMWLLFEDDALRLDEKVAAIVPEFGTHGKDVIDVETLMLHAGGFPLAPFRQDFWNDRGKLLEAFSQWKLNWPVDSRFEYHATSAHWVMSEIIERRAGMPWKQFIAQRLLGPMGLDELFVGCPPRRRAVRGRTSRAARWLGRGHAAADHQLQPAARACVRRTRRWCHRLGREHGAVLPAAGERRRHP
jgi:CubicO group peptidase (beta-lactamase class C family)